MDSRASVCDGGVAVEDGGTALGGHQGLHDKKKSLPVPSSISLLSDYLSTSIQMVSLRVWAKTEIMKYLKMVKSYKSGATMLENQTFPGSLRDYETTNFLD